MSDQINDKCARDFRRRLLASVSALALAVSFSIVRAQAASTFLANGDRPPLWIELGGDAVQTDGGQVPWVPIFEAASGSLTGGSEQASLQKAPRLNLGLDGRISYEPVGTDWVLSASISYGRGQRSGRFHKSNGPVYYAFIPILDTHDRSAQNHTIIDFMVGKDVGLGMTHGRSSLNIGLRIAQFGSDVRVFATSSPRASTFRQFRYHGVAQINRNTSALGPTVSWNGAAPVVGSLDTGLAIDWSANAAILFGRQKVGGQTSTQYNYHTGDHQYYTTNVTNLTRGKKVVIPNVGGSLGISYRLPAVKLSLGYRADVFFNAVDGGVETRKSYSRGFYGPFASVSIGIGG